MEFPEVWTRVPISEKVDPSSEDTAREGLSQGASVLGTRSIWANKTPPTGPAPSPPWLCTESVQGGSLGGMHIFAGPGVSCVPEHPCRVFSQSGNKTAGSERFLERQQVYLSGSETSPNQLNHLGSAARDSSSDAWLSRPGTWMAQSDLRCFWLQRRRFHSVTVKPIKGGTCWYYFCQHHATRLILIYTELRKFL